VEKILCSPSYSQSTDEEGDVIENVGVRGCQVEVSPKFKKDLTPARPSERIILLGSYFRKSDENLILSAKMLPDLGERVYDEKLREVGYVSGVFGRCNNFFVVVRCLKREEFPRSNEYYIIRRKETDTFRQKT